MSGKSGNKVKVRPWARFVPGLAWAVLIDVMDLLHAPLTVTLPFVGEPIGWVGDILQGAMSVVVFSNPSMWFFGTFLEVIAPSTAGIDVLIPSFTLGYIAITNGYDLISITKNIRKVILVGFILVVFLLMILFMLT